MNPDTEHPGPWSGTMEECNGWHVTSYDPATRNASETVVFALGSLAGVDPVELPPLHESIDPDALDCLFGPTVDGRPRAGGQVTFVHDGYTVAVSHDGEVRLRSPAESGESSAAGTAAGSDD